MRTKKRTLVTSKVYGFNPWMDQRDSLMKTSPAYHRKASGIETWIFHSRCWRGVGTVHTDHPVMIHTQGFSHFTNSPLFTIYENRFYARSCLIQRQLPVPENGHANWHVN